MKKLVLIIGILSWWHQLAQVDSLWVNDDRKYIEIQAKDTIVFHHIGIMPYDFEVICNNQPVSAGLYKVDFTKATLFLLPAFKETYNCLQNLKIFYKPYPDFLTRNYQLFDERNIFPNLTAAQAISFENNTKQNNFNSAPFEGLDTQGSIIRGITVGNNQDAILNSTLDLKIEGKLSPKITLSAHINDTNLPIQEDGYSQEFKDLDRVFIEMSAPTWQLKAGDIMLQDTTNYFLSFTKKIQGVSFQSKREDWGILTSGALVKGRYAYQEFQGQEGNQGPYKLKGENGELYIFIIQNSERVYIDGILQQKGQNEDYIIDYYTGEITFTPTNPINAETRIFIEYQYSERNYTRWMTYNTVNYNSKKLTTGISFYKESDLKNQSLGINLSDQQKEALSSMDTASNILWSESAIETPYDENKILYRKIVVNTSTHYFEYSNDPLDVLYEVGFTYIGKNKGDYRVLEYLGVGKKMLYVGENAGDYKALFPIQAPSALQVSVLNVDFIPNEKTEIDFEIALSQANNNLFSNQKSNQNPALKAAWKQTLWNRKWKGVWLNQIDYLTENFKTPEALFQVEFKRDWNLKEAGGNQSLWVSQLKLESDKKSYLDMKYEKLNYSNTYSGNRWLSSSDINWNLWNWQHQNSYLKSNNKTLQTNFVRHFNKLTYQEKKWWTSWDVSFEKKKIIDITLQAFDKNSFKSLRQNIVFGIGDTTKIFLKSGVQYIKNDSIISNQFNYFYKSKSAWLETNLIQNENSKLAFYAFIRNSNFVYSEEVQSFTNKMNYRQNLWKNTIQFQTEYQNVSGQLAQQDYNYIETNPGQGYYTWIDFNANGIKELDEFEIAKFQDEANYLRILLPNIIYLPTQEAKFSQQLVWNPARFSAKKGFLKLVSHFNNQMQIFAHNAKIKNANEPNLNPFDTNNTLNQNISFQNQFYFNQGKSNYTTGYIFKKTNQKIWQSFGTQYQNLLLHLLVFQHLIKEQVQINIDVNYIENKNTNNYFLNKNFNIFEREFKPYITYYFDKNHWIKTAYQIGSKSNTINDKEHLKSNKLMFNYQYNGKKDTRFLIDFQYINNNFIGEENSPVGYQMLEGLNAGKNGTMNVILTKKLNEFLYLNLNYNGRINQTSPAVHNGSVQLKAQF